jgi:hypothetical protein
MANTPAIDHLMKGVFQPVGLRLTDREEKRGLGAA